ncbi:MAG: WYL domain-containing protein [Myxococcales bacterium]|nr:WYL domain-containing protein [Myxococcales bacterium]
MHASTDTRTKRLLDLVVLLLDARRPISLAELREQFAEYRSAKPEAGARAFERDKATLLEMGVPIRYVTLEDVEDAPSEGGYIIDRQKYRLPEVVLSPDEVAVLVATAAAVRHQSDFPYRHAAELAVRKLMFDLSGLPARRRSRRSAQQHGSTAPSPAQLDVMVHLPTTYKSGSLASHLEQVETAIHNRKRITFEYDAHRGSGWLSDGDTGGTESSVIGPSLREVDPYGLVYRQGAWLLVGFCHRAQGLRRFRIDRILKLTVAPRPKTPDFDIPADFSLQEQGAISPWRFEREAKVRARLFVSADTPWVADEDFGPAARSPGADHGQPGTLVEFECGNPDYLISRVLSASGSLRVLAPVTLRQRVTETARAISRRNVSPGQSEVSVPRTATRS